MPAIDCGDGFELQAQRIGNDVWVYRMPSEPDDFDISSVSAFPVPLELVAAMGDMLARAAREGA